MQYLVNVDHNSMVAHLTRRLWRVVRSAVYPAQWMGLMMVYSGMTVKRVGMLW